MSKQLFIAENSFTGALVAVHAADSAEVLKALAAHESITELEAEEHYEGAKPATLADNGSRLFTKEECKELESLCDMVLTSRQNVGKRMLEQAKKALAITLYPG